MKNYSIKDKIIGGISLVSNDDLVKTFEDKWKNISKLFQENIREEIKAETIKRLNNIGRVRIAQTREINIIVAAAFYGAQHDIISSKIVYPKTLKETAGIFNIRTETLIKRRKKIKGWI